MKLINESLIKINLELDDKAAVINEITDILCKNDKVIDRDRLIQDIYIRENEASTSMGWGIAIPHAQTNAIKEPCLVFIKTRDSVEWNGDLTNIFFGIFVPKGKSESLHLKILAAIARKLMNNNFRRELINNNDVNSVFSLLSKIELEIRD